MNPLPTILLLVPVLSLPHPQPVHLPPQPSVLTNCITENYKYSLNRVKKCTDCFDRTSSHPLSRDGIPQAKDCIEQFLPVAADDCKDAIDALEPENVDKANKVLECFGITAQRITAEDCIDKVDEDNLIDTLTDAVICLKDIYANVIIEQEVEIETEEKEEEESKIFPFTPHLTSLCEFVSANEEDLFSCSECFKDSVAVDIVDNQHFEFIADCSEKHLDPLFSECTEIIKKMIANNTENDEALGQQVFLCSKKVVTKHLVEQCSEGVENISVDNLLAVAECTHNLQTS